jgi:BlaI family penicillinase repressor
VTKPFVDFDERLRQYSPTVATTRPHPTKAELDILRVLWASGPLSVREVRNVLNDIRPTGYTSVLKTMQIMTEKGLVERDDSSRPQIYRARYSQDRTQKQILTDLIQRVYGGSVRALVMHAIGTRNPSQADLDAMQKLLDRFERGEK